jgi:choline dehydrogenase-like flavoprotein
MPIGNYWNEHPSGEIAQFISEEKGNNSNIQRLTKMHLVPNRNFIKKEKINNITIDFYEHKNNENIKKTLIHRIKDLACIAPNLGKKIVDSLINLRPNLRPVHCFFSVLFNAEQKPTFNNKIILSDKTDIHGMPKVKLYWNIQSDVFRTLRIVLENIGEQLIKKKYGRIGIDRYVFDESFKFSKDIFANFHHIGGTIMGDNQSNSVVDKNLKVHNTENLYILGSSTFTTGGFSHPTFSIVQFSLRLADHLSS